jgi:hypothetical protein
MRISHRTNCFRNTNRMANHGKHNPRYNKPQASDSVVGHLDDPPHTHEAEIPGSMPVVMHEIGAV